jgi:hypothetical protein
MSKRGLDKVKRNSELPLRLGTFGATGSYLFGTDGSSISGGSEFIGGRPSASATWGYNFKF